MFRIELILATRHSALVNYVRRPRRERVQRAKAIGNAPCIALAEWQEAFEIAYHRTRWEKHHRLKLPAHICYTSHAPLRRRQVASRGGRGRSAASLSVRESRLRFYLSVKTEIRIDPVSTIRHLSVVPFPFSTARKRRRVLLPPLAPKNNVRDRCCTGDVLAGVAPLIPFRCCFIISRVCANLPPPPPPAPRPPSPPRRYSFRFRSGKSFDRLIVLITGETTAHRCAFKLMHRVKVPSRRLQHD